MENKGKRERNANFSREETETLVSLVESHKHVIENKKSDMTTWQEKEKAWQTIETDFNISGGEVYRDAKHLKSKYEAMKRDIRKKWNFIRENNKTGGVRNDVSPLTPIQQRVTRMMSPSTDGDETSGDSDPLDVAESDAKTPRELFEESTERENLVETIDTDIANSSNIYIQIKTEASLPTSRASSYIDTEDGPQDKCAQRECSTTTLKSKKHPVSCNPRPRRPFDKLSQRKLEIIELQKKVIQEELQEKILKKLLLENEMKHKKELYELEKEERLLKIQILKLELENKKTS